MKKLAIIRIIPLLAALALLAGLFMSCSSTQSVDFTQDPPLVIRPDPKDPEAPPYVEAVYDGTRQIDVQALYRQGFRKVIVKNVPITIWTEKNRTTMIVPAINAGQFRISEEFAENHPLLIKQIEDDRRYAMWLQLEMNSSQSGESFIVACVKDIEGLRSVEEIEAEQAREAAEKEAREEARKERIALADRIIAKKYGSLFSSYSDYANWRQRQWQNGNQFMESLLLNQEKTYSENDMFIVEKHKLEIKDMQFAAGGGFAYLVGSIGHIGGYSRPCYLISATQIPYTTVPQALISSSLLLEYVGQEQYREGYQVRTCDVFLAFMEGSREYANYKNMLEDVARIAQNPSEYAHILDE